MHLYIKHIAICLSSRGSSVGSDACCQSRGCEFESLLSQLSFRRLTSMRHASFVFHQWAKSMWKSSQLLGKIVVWGTGVRKPGNA